MLSPCFPSRRCPNPARGKCRRIAALLGGTDGLYARLASAGATKGSDEGREPSIEKQGHSSELAMASNLRDLRVMPYSLRTHIREPKHHTSNLIVTFTTAAILKFVPCAPLIWRIHESPALQKKAAESRYTPTNTSHGSGKPPWLKRNIVFQHLSGDHLPLP